MYLDSRETAHAHPWEAGGIVTVALLHLHEGPGRSVPHSPTCLHCVNEKGGAHGS